jgi:hypothetical protein
MDGLLNIIPPSKLPQLPGGQANAPRHFFQVSNRLPILLNRIAGGPILIDPGLVADNPVDRTVRRFRDDAGGPQVFEVEVDQLLRHAEAEPAVVKVTAKAV